MAALAGTFGCAADDYKCLCASKNWGYGIHDCSWQSCGNDAGKAKPAIDWANDECKKAGVPINLPAANVPVNVSHHPLCSGKPRHKLINYAGWIWKWQR